LKLITVFIRGKTPLLMHNPAGMLLNGGGKKQIPPPEVEAAAACYWTDDKSSLAFPSIGVHRAMIQVAKSWKIGRRSLAPYVAGSIQIEPLLIPLGTTDYAIDTRRAVVQRNAVMRSRPRLNTWGMEFTLSIDDEDFPTQQSVNDLRAVLEDAGKRIGIGDFRPQCYGPFGKFSVEHWQEAAG